jgi:phosphoribosylaminoimidazolecarboxamide formyltransferase / IMP cyclohydrolase
LKRALLSVSDKAGLEEFARVLTRCGIELVASGGTARALSAAGLQVTPVESVTGFPEMIGGRVKTLHPAIHAGILARRTPEHLAELAAQNISTIDLVVVNLYPFQATVARAETTFDDAIEQIDIGGVALIRAAAKNFEAVTVVCDPADYRAVAEEIERAGNTTRETRARLALKAFHHTAAYDAAIAQYLTRHIEDAESPSTLNLALDKVQDLRYGENPHQRAALYSFGPGAGPLGGEILQGKELSYNNLLDLDAAWRAAVSYAAPTICIVKHLSPCGIASAAKLADAFRRALESDPVSAFGGVIASNRAFDGETATALGELFVECIAAPEFSDDARAVLAKKKNCRLLSMPNLAVEPPYELRSITRGVLRQDVDAGDPAGTEWRVVTRRAPTNAEMESLRFAWRAVAHAKSNAIVFARGTATVGIGSGQPNRVDSVRIAATRAGEKSKGAVMASDAFFPFPDSVQVAADAGITAVVAPGGSVRDADAIAEADARGIAMVFTGVRHFRH